MRVRVCLYVHLSLLVIYVYILVPNSDHLIFAIIVVVVAAVLFWQWRLSRVSHLTITEYEWWRFFIVSLAVFLATLSPALHFPWLLYSFSWKILAPITLESIMQWNRTELILLKASLPPPSFAPFSQNEDDAINKIRFLSALTSCKIHLWVLNREWWIAMYFIENAWCVSAIPISSVFRDTKPAHTHFTISISLLQLLLRLTRIQCVREPFIYAREIFHFAPWKIAICLI